MAMIPSAHLSMLFRELPYLERPAAAAAAGFSVVETWWPGRELIEPWVAEVESNSLDVRLLNCDGGDIERGDRGFLNVPERRQETLAAFDAAVAVASHCGAPYVNLLVGRDTGSMSRDKQLAFAAEMLRECAESARDTAVRIVLEPINDRDSPGYLVPTPNVARKLMELAGCDDVLLLYDAYHAARMGADPCTDVTQWLPFVGHVHYADCPGRGAPGTGEIDLAKFVRALDEGGYDGALGFEFNAGPSTTDALAAVPMW